MRNIFKFDTYSLFPLLSYLLLPLRSLLPCFVLTQTHLNPTIVELDPLGSPPIILTAELASENSHPRRLRIVRGATNWYQSSSDPRELGRTVYQI